MPYNDQTKILKRPLNTADIALAINERSLDVGTLCSSPRINPFAKYKPIYTQAIPPVSENDRLTANHGLVIPEYSSPSLLLDATATWSYTARTRYQMIDFANPTDYATGYYTDAPTCIMTCPIRGDIAVNSLNEESTVGKIPFYCFVKNSAVSGADDRDIDETLGMGSKHSPARDSTQMGMSLGPEDLSTSAGNTIFNSNQPFRFGLALFSYNEPYTFQDTIECGRDFTPYQSTGAQLMEAYQLSMESITGRYLAIPYAKIYKGQNVAYIPLHKYPISTGTIYPGRFRFSSDGADMYRVQYSFSTDPNVMVTSTSTTNSYIDINAIVKTNLDYRHVTTNATIAEWTLPCDISGTVYEGTQEYTIDRDNVATTMLSPTGGFIIMPGGYALLTYRINMIWSVDGVSSLSVTQGNLQITPKLSFRGARVGYDSTVGDVFVTYG
jgi:hypothetical protein